MARTTQRMSSLGCNLDSINDGQNSCRSRFSDREGTRERCYAISHSGQHTSSEQAPLALRFAIRVLIGLWTFTTLLLDGWFRLKECLPSLKDLRHGSTLPPIQEWRRDLSTCRTSSWACIEPVSLHPSDFTNNSFLRILTCCARGSLTFPSRLHAGNTALAEYLGQFGNGIPLLILAYLGDFLVARHSKIEVANWMGAMRELLLALIFEFKESKCQWAMV